MATKLPIQVIVARDKKHLGKEEIERRMEQEPHSPDTRIEPPASLTTKKQKARFRELAQMLANVGVWAEMHADELARYIQAQEQYERLTKEMNSALRTHDLDESERIQRMQNKAYQQAHTSASSLGLNVTSLCKLVVPKAMKESPPDDGMDL